MTSAPSPLASRFVEYVETRLATDGRTRGVLRNPGRRPWEAQSLVAPFVPEGEWMDEKLLLAGAGWVARFGPARGGVNLGDACAAAAAAGTASRASLERRLLALCRCTPSGAVDQLPRLLGMLGAHCPDWAQLLDDLSRWERQRERIANRWLRSFYRTTEPTNPTT